MGSSSWSEENRMDVEILLNKQITTGSRTDSAPELTGGEEGKAGARPSGWKSRAHLEHIQAELP